MSKPRFRLSTLLLVAALATVSIIWAIERQQYADRLSEQVEREGAMASTLAGALFRLNVHYNYKHRSRAEFERRLDNQLFTSFVFLFGHRDNTVTRKIDSGGGWSVTRDEAAALRQMCRDILRALNISSPEEFLAFYQSGNFGGFWDDELLDADGELSVELRGFIEEVLAYREDGEAEPESSPVTP